MEILEKGELQVADRERESQLSIQSQEIATILAKTVNLVTERPYTIRMVEEFMQQVQVAVNLRRTSKQQALDVIRESLGKFSITRARMKLHLRVPTNHIDQLSTALNSWNSQIESREEMTNTSSLVFKIDPGHFRECDNLVSGLQGTLEVVSIAVQGERESNIDDFNDDDDDYNAAHVSYVDEERLTQQLRDSACETAEVRRRAGSISSVSKESASADTGGKAASLQDLQQQRDG